MGMVEKENRGKLPLMRSKREVKLLFFKGREYKQNMRKRP